MTKMLIELMNSEAAEMLHNLEKGNIIRIVNEDMCQYSLPGNPMTPAEFNGWIENAEKSPAISLNEAKSLWATQKKKLKNPIQ